MTPPKPAAALPASETFSYDLKVPKDRLAVIIGPKGVTKKQIEHATKTRLSIDSDEGDITIAGKDALLLYAAREIVRAIGRGFSPETAMQLLKQDYSLEIIQITDYASTPNDIQRLKGRIIGEEGKSRRTIEDMTGAEISVYGKTVALIGNFDALELSRRAVDSLLAGATHASVWRWLERRRRELRMRDLSAGPGF